VKAHVSLIGKESDMYVEAKPRPAPRLNDLIALIRSEYREMPGLSLTLEQAQRLWSLDRSTCITVFERLVQMGALRTTKRGRYICPDRSGDVTPV
jgi:hypothetical protein